MTEIATPIVANPDPSELLNSMQDGVAKLEMVHMAFRKMHSLAEAQKRGIDPNKEVETFLDRAKLLDFDQIPTDSSLDQTVAIRITGQDPVISVGYLDFLQSQESRYVSAQAEAWAQSEDVKNFIGQSIVIRSVDETTQYPSMHPYVLNGEVSGRIKAVSLFGGNHQSGLVSLEEASFKVNNGLDNVMRGSREEVIVTGLFTIEHGEYRGGQPSLVIPRVEFEFDETPDKATVSESTQAVV